MTDMSQLKKKEYPAQRLNRLQWQLDTIRANQLDVAHILMCAHRGWSDTVQLMLKDLHKHDRDALLQPGGILTQSQIEALK